MAIIKFDPTRSWFSMPSWDDFEDNFQKGLKVKETDKAIIVEAVVAGIPTKDVEVGIEDGILTIKGQTKEEKTEGEEYKASSYSYYYTTALSGGDWSKAEADIENGIVKVTIPKEEKAKARKITVKAKAE